MMTVALHNKRATYHADMYMTADVIDSMSRYVILRDQSTMPIYDTQISPRKQTKQGHGQQGRCGTGDLGGVGCPRLIRGDQGCGDPQHKSLCTVRHGTPSSILAPLYPAYCTAYHTDTSVYSSPAPAAADMHQMSACARPGGRTLCAVAALLAG